MYRKHQDEIKAAALRGDRIEVSQRNFLRMTWRAAAKVGPALEMCTLCYNMGEGGAGLKLEEVFVSGCKHVTCLSCARNHVRSGITNDRGNIVCFEHGCGRPIGGPDVNALLFGTEGWKDMLETYERLLTERAMAQ